MNWQLDASPEPTGTPDPGRVVGKEFFARSADRSAKTLAGAWKGHLFVSPCIATPN